MDGSLRDSGALSPMLRVVSGDDRFGDHRGLGITVMDFKVAAQDTNGAFFLLEHTFHSKGGPARHLHHDQDEWFYVLEGEFLFEVGGEAVRLTPGDSLLAPRKVPHVWAHAGEGRGLDAAAGPGPVAGPRDGAAGAPAGRPVRGIDDRNVQHAFGLARSEACFVWSGAIEGFR